MVEARSAEVCGACQSRMEWPSYFSIMFVFIFEIAIRHQMFSKVCWQGSHTQEIHAWERCPGRKKLCNSSCSCIKASLLLFGDPFLYLFHHVVDIALNHTICQTTSQIYQLYSHYIYTYIHIFHVYSYDELAQLGLLSVPLYHQLCHCVWYPHVFDTQRKGLPIASWF
jgi:hypothetical protein